MVTLKASALTILCCMASAPAGAQSWTAGVFAGTAHSQPADVRLTDAQTDLKFRGVRFDSRSFETPPYYGYRLAHRLSAGRVLWLEAELIHLKTYARVDAAASDAGRLDGRPVDRLPMASIVERFAMSHGLNFLLANLVVRVPLDERGALRLVARGGAGPTIPHAESTLRGLDREQYEFGGVGVQVSAGLERRIRRPLFVTVEYKLTDANVTVHPAAGELRTRVLSHHAAFGLTAAF
jgi:hypothetical protein